jgi:hypothetical protein
MMRGPAAAARVGAPSGSSASDVQPRLWIPVAAFVVWIVIWPVTFATLRQSRHPTDSCEPPEA